MRKVGTILFAMLVLIPAMGVDAQQTAAIVNPFAAEMENRLRLATSNEDYPVTPGDIYGLKYQQGDTTVTVALLVEGDYSINLGVFGKKDASGMTFAQLKRSAEKAISTGYPRSMPSLTISSLGVFSVHVVGETLHADYVTAWGFSRVSDTIKDLRSPSSSLRNVEVVSRSGNSRKYDLFKAMRLGSASEDPFVKPGDTVILHRRERSVEIAGEVYRPGVYDLLPGEQLGELLASYGDGLTTRADASRSRIERMSGDQPTVEYVNLASASANDVVLRNGDVVTIPPKTANLPAVIFEGAVIPPGVATTPAGAATGGTPPGGPSAAALPGETAPGGGMREESGTNTALQYNRFIHPFTEGETLSDALRAVKGSLAPLADLAAAFVVRDGRTDPIYIDMRALVTSSASPADLRLQANDRIIIPPFSSFVSVHGAVFAPGSFPYRAGLPVWYYVSLAGGVDPERNSSGQVIVTDPQGKTRKSSEPPRAGDFIFVSNNDFFYNLNKYAPTITLVATLVATTITVLSFLSR